MNEISRLRRGKNRRASSYDRSGGNKDYFTIASNQVTDIADLIGAGYVRHLWMTMATLEDDAVVEFLPRKVVLRIYWDGCDTASVEAPIGDFFGMGHGMTKNYVSAPFTMSPEDGKGFNCYFPMPFRNGAKFQVENQSEVDIKFYFYVDYEEHEEIPEDELRFHARWHRESQTQGIDDAEVGNEFFEFGGKNTTGEGNYVILDTEGKGHYVGCNMSIHNLRMTNEWNWYGEGDDMIFIDGEPWPPRLHGTGMEDYFNTAWCPQQEQCAPYHGIILGGGENWSGKISVYRYHILDPIMFEKSIKVTIEHGHNNHRSDDISSTAYWYQEGVSVNAPPMPPVEKRLPLPTILPQRKERLAEVFGHQNP